MLNFGNKEFRNLQEQVLANMNNIEALASGIKIVGKGTELPEQLGVGEAFLYGEEAPYTLYVGVEGTMIEVGEFPLQGPQGIPGARGETGIINSVETSTVTLEPGLNASVSATTENNNIHFDFEIPQGLQGIQGPRGERGLQGIQGPKGETGGSPRGVFANISELSAAYPTGNDYIYITSDNGNWNYWNASTSSWANGGTFISDGNTYVPQTTTIAGIALTGNISAASLTNALVFANNSEIDATLED